MNRCFDCGSKTSYEYDRFCVPCNVSWSECLKLRENREHFRCRRCYFGFIDKKREEERSSSWLPLTSTEGCRDCRLIITSPIDRYCVHCHKTYWFCESLRRDIFQYRCTNCYHKYTEKNKESMSSASTCTKCGISQACAVSSTGFCAGCMSPKMSSSSSSSSSVNTCVDCKTHPASQFSAAGRCAECIGLRARSSSSSRPSAPPPPDPSSAPDANAIPDGPPPAYDETDDGEIEIKEAPKAKQKRKRPDEENKKEESEKKQKVDPELEGLTLGERLRKIREKSRNNAITTACTLALSIVEKEGLSLARDKFEECIILYWDRLPGMKQFLNKRCYPQNNPDFATAEKFFKEYGLRIFLMSERNDVFSYTGIKIMWIDP